LELWWNFEREGEDQMMGGFGFGPMWMFGGLFSLVFWALLIGLAVWLIVSATRGDRTRVVASGPAPSPLDILKVRYAKGEINKEQYEETKRDLSV
jgi:putative membrane protein